MKTSGREHPPNISIFDCDVGFGESGLGHRIITDPAELCRVMDRYGIDEALVYDIQMVEGARVTPDDAERLLKFCDGGVRGSGLGARETTTKNAKRETRHTEGGQARNPPHGRRAATKQIQNLKSKIQNGQRLHPTVPIVPPGIGEQPGPKELADWLKASGIRAVRAWPAWHAFDFLPYCMGPLLEILEERRVPVILSYWAPGTHPWPLTPNWDHIDRTARAFPKLPIVVTTTGMLQDRRWLPLMNECANVRCDISSATFGLVEHVCRTLGAERLLFGSRFPYEEPGLLSTWPRYADIPEKAARMIAGDNLRGLLRAVRF